LIRRLGFIRFAFCFRLALQRRRGRCSGGRRERAAIVSSSSVGKLMSRSRRERAGAIAKPVAIETASHAARILRRINTTALHARVSERPKSGFARLLGHRATRRIGIAGSTRCRGAVRVSAWNVFRVFACVERDRVGTRRRQRSSCEANLTRRANPSLLQQRASWEADLVEAVFGVSLRNQATNT
jgi:hypothetical protein